MTRHPRGVAKGSDRDHSRWIARSIAITNNMLCKGQGEKCYGSMAPPFEDAIPKRIVYTPVCPPEVSFSRVSKVTPSLSQGFRGCRGLAVAVPSFFGVSTYLVCWSQSLLLSSQGHPFGDTSFGVFLLRSLVWHSAIRDFVAAPVWFLSCLRHPLQVFSRLEYYLRASLLCFFDRNSSVCSQAFSWCLPCCWLLVCLESSLRSNTVYNFLS
jgi:hypothetical protein